LGVDHFSPKDLPQTLHEGFALYPNPNRSNQVNIAFNDVTAYENVGFELWSAMGMRVQSVRLEQTISTIVLSDIPAGAYTFRIHGDGHVLKIGKFIQIR
jgi:hypothetical protein